MCRHKGSARAGLVGFPRVICGLRWSWCSLPVDYIAVPILPTSGAEGRNNHCAGSLSPVFWDPHVIALETVWWW